MQNEHHERELPIPPLARGAVALLALALLIGGIVTVLKPFFVPLAWAAVLAIIVWPAFRWLRRRLHRWPALSALLMTITVALLAFGLIIPLASTFAHEGAELFRSLRAALEEEQSLYQFATTVPVVGAELAELLVALELDRTSLRSSVAEYEGQLVRFARSFAGGVLRTGFQLFICLVSLYFVLRHGEHLAVQSRRALNRIAPTLAHRLVTTAHRTVQGVVVGIIATALFQGLLAGAGYWLAGVDYPVFLSGVTMLASVIPFGTPLVYLPVVVSLFMEGTQGAALALLVWCVVVVSSVDNVVRAVMISRAVNMSMLVTFLGVLGGISAFGFLGVFLGPVLLMSATVLWRDWLDDRVTNTSTAPISPTPRGGV